jgi:creatinine amidohydrolase/Fe(II)-dependent formamide hydrolase-like protein
VNGHGGNASLLPYFCQLQLEKQKDYAVYLFTPDDTEEYENELQGMRQTNWDGHAGETESSLMLATDPELGQLILDYEVAQLAHMSSAVKADQQTIQLQNQFYEDANKPLETEQ